MTPALTPSDGFLPPASSERKSADRRERLRVLLHTLSERRWLILAIAGVIVAIVTLQSAAQDDKYEAVSKVLVGQTDPVNGLFPGASADSDPDRVARTNQELIENATVAERVVERQVGEDLSASEVLDRSRRRSRTTPTSSLSRSATKTRSARPRSRTPSRSNSRASASARRAATSRSDRARADRAGRARRGRARRARAAARSSAASATSRSRPRSRAARSRW